MGKQKDPTSRGKETCPLRAPSDSSVATARPLEEDFTCRRPTIAMPLTSWTEWAADASADATKVIHMKETSKEASAAELQNNPGAPRRWRRPRLDREKSNENDRPDRGRASPRKRAASNAAVASKTAPAQHTAELRYAPGGSSRTHEPRPEQTENGNRNGMDRGRAPPQSEAASTEAVASKEARTSKAASNCIRGNESRARQAHEDTAGGTTDGSTHEPPPAKASKRAATRGQTAREASRAACRATADRPSTSDGRRRDRPCKWGRATAAARYALLACSLLVWVDTPRPGPRPHTGPGTRRKTRAGASRKSPHEHRRKPKVETSYGSRRRPKDEPFTSRNRGFVWLESQIASKILVSYVWYSLNWNIICQRLPWQSAGSGGDHA
jgi:hypothetical protein